MSAYDFDFGIFWKNFLPAALRNKVIDIAWGKVLMKPFQYLRDLFFEVYANGFTGVKWNVIDVYFKGDRVRYIDRSVYEALQSVPAGTLPTDTTYWRKIVDVWIGVAERVMYNGSKLVLEYALNKWFETTFRQPDDVATPTPSDIYLENNHLDNDVFVTASIDGSLVASYDNDAFVASDYSFQQASFSIWIPLAIYNALGANDTDRTNAVRNFADKYVIAGVLYDVKTY